ncbi:MULTISPECIES: PilN domain-containing protein [Planktothricoides]|uniref:PilN domain-containing protein n=1 Tax=Planktothricoides raciborskii FACHB-1370 TaxID=2949576 RepID=A0ABR8EAY6_9CYAN|nr:MULTISPECIES: PilN domain-containing protein [Planktothricoides]MBD2542762.1 PilN domain-containing protein [Planktothricoides raciborskii FACHB-1370]MBD2581491.1 PilN domain-containing protein [Planktothricoides raciborskii FACHB-1261]
MYSIDINFLNDRPDYKPPDISKPIPGKQTSTASLPFLIGGAAVAVAAICSAGGWWWIVTTKNAQLQAEITKLESESGLLEAEVKKVEELENKTKQYNEQTKFFTSIFNTSVKPVSSLLDELSSILPPGMQLSQISQTLKPAEGENIQANTPWGVISQDIEITGLSPSFAEVNDLLLILKSSPFFNEKETALVEAELIEIPIQVEWTGIGDAPENLTPKVVQYKISTKATNVLASEILPDLQRTNAQGLLSRLNRLQQLGVKFDDTSK